VIEAILEGQSTNNWDGTLNLKNTYKGHLRRFFNDVLGSLESAIDTKSKILRRPMQTLLFQFLQLQLLPLKGNRADGND
jgi:hypothetical protein